MGFNFCDTCKHGDSYVCVECYMHDRHEPNEAEKAEEVEKTYTTGQMIDTLLGNRDLKAKIGDVILSWDGNILKYNASYSGQQTWFVDIKDRDFKWTIIEPKPEAVAFAEAFKAFKNNKQTTIESCVTGNKYYYSSKLFGDVTDTEVEGKWIVSG